jgi:hypothetical protein
MHTLEKPFKIVGVHARHDAMSDPRFAIHPFGGLPPTRNVAHMLRTELGERGNGGIGDVMGGERVARTVRSLATDDVDYSIC